MSELAFSIMQPWAWLIVNGHKDIENRDWRPMNPGLRFRGHVLIHAGKKVDKDAVKDMFEGLNPATLLPFDPPIIIPDRFDLGGIVGEAEIIRCVRRHSSPWFFGPYGFVIKNAQSLPFRPCKGALGFFKPTFEESACLL